MLYLNRIQKCTTIAQIIFRNHGVVAVGSNIDQARAVVEALEEWAKILTVAKIFGGPKYVLDNSICSLKSLNGCDR